MRKIIILCLFLGVFMPFGQVFAAPSLEKVAVFNKRPGNVAVTAEGRVFVTMHPFDSPKIKLLELKPDGKAVAYPDDKWAQAPLAANSAIGFLNPLALRVTPDGQLYVLDMGDKGHGPRIVQIDLLQNMVMRVFYIPAHVITEQSFLQDFAYDWVNSTIYIADMGQADLSAAPKPAIIAVDVRTGLTRVVLKDVEILKPNTNTLKAGGQDVVFTKGSEAAVPVKAGLNPISLYPQMDYLYFAGMNEGKVYRIHTNILQDDSLTFGQKAEQAEIFGDKRSSDGMSVDAGGNVYLTNIERGGIDWLREGKPTESLLTDERLSWPDGTSYGDNGYIYVTANQLHKAAVFNGGVEGGKPPYALYRFKAPTPGAIGR